MMCVGISLFYRYLRIVARLAYHQTRPQPMFCLFLFSKPSLSANGFCNRFFTFIDARKSNPQIFLKVPSPRRFVIASEYGHLYTFLNVAFFFPLAKACFSSMRELSIFRLM